MYAPLQLAVPMCGILGSDTQAMIKAMAVILVDFQAGLQTGQARAAAEGREMAYIRHRFSFVLQQVLL